MDDSDELIVIQMLVNQGALEIFSVDKNGEPVYRITPKCKEIFPELFYSHVSDVNNMAFDLWELGVVEIEFTEENYKVSFKPENYLKYREVKETLNEEQLSFLKIIVDINLLESLENPDT
jgi:hypothetical protein